MTCEGCSSGINQSFAVDFPNYKSHVDYKSKTMIIKSKDGSDIDEKKSKKLLKRWDLKGADLSKSNDDSLNGLRFKSTITRK